MMSTNDYKKKRGPQVFTLRNIAAGEELLVSYGMTYWFEKRSITALYKYKTRKESGSPAA